MQGTKVSLSVLFKKSVWRTRNCPALPTAPTHAEVCLPAVPSPGVVVRGCGLIPQQTSKEHKPFGESLSSHLKSFSTGLPRG